MEHVGHWVEHKPFPCPLLRPLFASLVGLEVRDFWYVSAGMQLITIGG